MKPSLRLFRNCSLFSTHCAPCRGVSPLSACSCPVHAVREAGNAGSDGMSVTIGSVSSAAKNSHTHTHTTNVITWSNYIGGFLIPEPKCWLPFGVLTSPPPCSPPPQGSPGHPGTSVPAKPAAEVHESLSTLALSSSPLKSGTTTLTCFPK